MSDFLSTAVAQARARTVAAARRVPLDLVTSRAAAAGQVPALGAALSAGGCAVIAEIKRASPSRGPFGLVRGPAELARAYADGGAAAVSVLTEPEHFQGSMEDLAVVADAVRLPVLRKDFIVDPYQVWEARASRAAAVLLIVAALDQTRLVTLLHAAAEAGLGVLVEVHQVDEVHRAGAAWEAVGEAAPGAGLPLILGVNARDLSTLQVDPGRFEKLRGELPDGAIAVAESGVGLPE
ncbi:MAG: indole-3-glycerol-phosphate synthase, partial [Actinomycetota bacterium]|nr:indole-3-glycerol-phosphate synthase [Actinomycetota bacterium]